MNTSAILLTSGFLRCPLLVAFFCFNPVHGTSKPWGLLCALARAWFVQARKICDPFALSLCYLVLVTTDVLLALLAVAAAWYIQASQHLAEELLHSSRQPMGSTRLKSVSANSWTLCPHRSMSLWRLPAAARGVGLKPARSQPKASPATSLWGAAPAALTYPLQLVLSYMHQLFLDPSEDSLAAGVYRFCILIWHAHLGVGRCHTFLSSSAIFATLHHSSLSKHVRCNGLGRAGEDSKDDRQACIVSFCFTLSYVIPTSLFFPT